MTFIRDVSASWRGVVHAEASRRVLTGTGWSIVGNGLARALAIATALAAARILGREDFGALSLVQLTTAAVANMVSLQLGQTATRFIAEFRHSSSGASATVARLVKRISLVSGLGATAILFVAAGWVSRAVLHQVSLQPLLRLSAPAVLLTLYSGVQLGILWGHQRFRAAAFVNAAGYAWIFAGVLAGSLYAGLRGAVAGWVIGSALLCLCGSYALRRIGAESPPPQQPDQVSLRSILFAYSLPLFLASVWLSLVLLRCTAALAEHHSLTEVALYSAADRVHLMLLFVPTALFSTTFPVLASLHSNGNRAGYREVLHTTKLAVGVTLVVPAVLVGTTSAVVLSATFGQAFRAAGPVLSILCVASIFEAVNTNLGQLFVIAGRVWLRSAIDFGLGLMLFVSATVLIPRLGGIGLAGAYAFSFAAASAVLFTLFPVIRAPQQRISSRDATWQGHTRGVVS